MRRTSLSVTGTGWLASKNLDLSNHIPLMLCLLHLRQSTHPPSFLCREFSDAKEIPDWENLD